MKSNRNKNNRLKDFFRFAGVSAIALTFSFCANEGQLTGGKKDTSPPRLLAAKPSNKTTNFAVKEFVLKFDENINPAINYSEILISPPLSEMPVITVTNRKVKVALKENLLPNTTYTFNFGDAIKDLNESNAAGNLAYVVSTGSYIDSALITGKIVMANDLKPAENYLAVIYRASDKKDFTKDKPLYFARTDKSGSFSIENLPKDSFHLYALKDQNLNYYYDLPNEEIGFVDTAVQSHFSVTPATDTSATKPTMNKKGFSAHGSDLMLKAFFSTNPKPKLTAVSNPIKGKLVFTYNSPINNWKIEPTPEIKRQKAVINQLYDTVIYWYSTSYMDTMRFVTQIGDTLSDTTRIAWNDSLTTVRYEKTKFSQTTKNQSSINKTTTVSAPSFVVQSPLESFKIVFPVPIDSINQSKELVFYDDSTKKQIPAKAKIGGEYQEEIFFSAAFEEGQKYRLRLPDSLLLFFNGEYNAAKDYFTATGRIKEYGNMQIKVTIKNPNDYYIIRLLNANKEVVREFFTYGKTALQQDVNHIPQGKYTMQAVKDQNANARWDTGDFGKRQQPESIITFKEEHELKGGWDLEIKIEL